MQKDKKNEKQSRNKTGLIRFTCPSCKILFGLLTDFIEKTGETNFRYNCPYCGYRSKV